MLSGIRIIEVEGLGPAPFCSMLLADLGAEVIVVHREKHQKNVKCTLIDRGKRSIILNLKDKRDLAIFLKLIKNADGLIEGFRPGVMERLGAGPKICHSLNPRLVYGRMTGWGQKGELSKAAGHDLNYIAICGALFYASLPNDAPVTPPTMQGDMPGALYLAIGMLAGIINARTTGKGSIVDAAIVDSVSHMMNLLLSLKQSGGFSFSRGKSLLDGPHWSRTYRAKDNAYMSVQAFERKFYDLFLQKLGLDSDKDFASQHDHQLWPRLTKRLEKIFASKTQKQWEEIFSTTDCCVAPVLNLQQAMDNLHMRQREIYFTKDGVLQAAPAPRFFNSLQRKAGAIPKRDGNREEILNEIKTYGFGYKAQKKDV